MDARDLGPEIRLWGRPAALEALQARLRRQLAARREPEIVFSGSGDFHHISALLIARAIESSEARVTVVHCDNHPDWVKFSNGIHCGSWVSRAARLSGVSRVLTIGTCSSDIDRPHRKGADLSLIEQDRVEIYAYRAPGAANAVRLCGREWPTIGTIGESAFPDYVLSRVDTEAVYVTIDKDVFRAEDAVTNWDQGCASLIFIMSLIERLAAHKRIVGADVFGDWSPIRYGGQLAARLAKRAESMIDQPWFPRERKHAHARNEPANLSLLKLFRAAG